MAQEAWWVWPVVRDQDRPRRALGPPCYLLIVNPSHLGQCFPRDPWKHLEKSLYLSLCVLGVETLYVCMCAVSVWRPQMSNGCLPPTPVHPTC